MCHGALAERGAEEEAARAAPSGPALPRGLPARGEAVLPARKAHPSSSAGRAHPLPCPPWAANGPLAGAEHDWHLTSFCSPVTVVASCTESLFH